MMAEPAQAFFDSTLSESIFAYKDLESLIHAVDSSDAKRNSCKSKSLVLRNILLDSLNENRTSSPSSYNKGVRELLRETNLKRKASQVEDASERKNKKSRNKLEQGKNAMTGSLVSPAVHQKIEKGKEVQNSNNVQQDPTCSALPTTTSSSACSASSCSETFVNVPRSVYEKTLELFRELLATHQDNKTTVAEAATAWLKQLETLLRK